MGIGLVIYFLKKKRKKMKKIIKEKPFSLVKK